MSINEKSSNIAQRAPLSVGVVGAGVSGLSLAWGLANKGCKVTVFDSGEAGRGATWAAAGMLAAGVEVEPGEESLWALNRRAQELWPAFRRELEQASGHDIGYRDQGTLVVATNRDDLEQLRFSYEFQRRLGVQLTWLNGLDARRMEPYLRPGIAGAVFSPNDHQVDNRKLAAALKQAALKAGVRLHENCRVERLVIEAGKACGLMVDSTVQSFDRIVIATGAWVRHLPGLPETARPPVRPVKGQMLALQMDPEQPLLRHVIWAPKLYLVPRNDGRLIIGATVEEKGFDDTLTAGGMLALLEGAWRAVPGIEELPIAETWVGHRPTSRDDAPIFGPVREVAGLHMATGHHRNGILLTPVTAEAMTHSVIEGSLPDWAAEFSLDRFAKSPHERDKTTGSIQGTLAPIGSRSGI
ncbi:glycine oxidase ThiO [Limibacillus sp. MBR-115]|jgi:glycine oxidase|uniref:glycine oxidase ThiO n=1 Tax=Limibacillus sp. MBR-115 TaxID=3156465 RepID=UPI003394078F